VSRQIAADALFPKLSLNSTTLLPMEIILSILKQIHETEEGNAEKIMT
jgi:hypothetical protein